MRFVVLHYHIFKNAGSTIDFMLEKSFGSNWVSFDDPDPTHRIAPEQMANFILQNPMLQAVSSHQAQLPLIAVPDMEVFPIVFFRHPLDRVRSIYDFERKQGIEKGPISKGADHASRLSFAEYLKWRLGKSKNGVVHNHQTLWLLSEKKYWNRIITEKDFEKAWQQLQALKFFGLVENFQRSIDHLSKLLMNYSIKLFTDYQIVNGNYGRHESLAQRLELVKETLGERLWGELVDRNRWDCLLYDLVTEEFAHRSNEACGLSGCTSTSIG